MKLTTMICGSVKLPSQNAITRLARARPRPMSQAIIVRLRFQRSMNAPAGSWTSRYGRVARKPTMPASAGECVSASTSSG